MQKLTEKQFIKRKTLYILHEILKNLVEPEQRESITINGVYKQFPKVSHLKDADTGEIRVGLSFKGVRKLVKKNPHITPEDVMKRFNIGHT